MRKIVSIFILLVVVSGLMLVHPSQSGIAQGIQTPSPTPYPGESEFITFSMLGIQDEVMLGPYATSYVRFSTPDSWLLQAGGVLRLSFETTVNTSRTFVGVSDQYSGALMEISLNGVVINTVFLRKGVQDVEIAIPVEALAPQREDGRHTIQLFLDATIDCLFEHETSVIVRSSSGFSLPYKAVSPIPNLTILPRPMYKVDSLLPKRTIITIPDNPTDTELRAAMIVAASMGRFSNGLMDLSLLNVGALTDTQKFDANLIAVGKQADLPIIGNVSFPVTAQDPVPQPSDGVVRLGPSPWNLENVVLYVGGDDDDGVIKAARALSSGALRVGSNPSLSVISDVAAAVQVESVETDRTFAMLGYPTRTMSGPGYQSLEYSFVIPYGKMPGADAALTLIYNHSAIIDFNASGAVVLINDQPVSSIRFTSDSANATQNLVISLPDYTMKPGVNTLVVQTEFIPVDYCSTLNDAGLWLTIFDASLLHLPLVDAASESIFRAVDLGVYPYPFINDPTLGNLAFVLPSNDSLSWGLGAAIASELGQYAAGATIELQAVDANTVSTDSLANYNLIVVGRASQVPLIEDLNDYLPAPFDAGSDVANESGAQIAYRVSPGTDLGYLELIASPWNSTNSILAVMGSTPTGLAWAGSAMTNANVRDQLLGNYVVVTEQKVYSVDTTLGLGTQNLSATAVPEDVYPTLIPDSMPETTFAYQQDWVVTAITVTSIAIGVVLLVLLLVSLRRMSIRKAIKKE